jgi:hypothetical protein
MLKAWAAWGAEVADRATHQGEVWQRVQAAAREGSLAAGLAATRFSTATAAAPPAQPPDRGRGKRKREDVSD